MSSMCNKVLLSALTAAVLTGCATTGGQGGRTAMDQAIARCLGTTVVTTLIGTVVGGGDGAAIGAGVGGGLCAVMLVLASEEDRKRARELELEAVIKAEPGETVSSSLTTQNGQQVTLTTIVDNAAPPPSSIQQAERTCRYAQTTFATGGSSQQLDRQIYCRTTDGNWEPYAA